MTGRLENRIKTENRIKANLEDAPAFVRDFYYSLNDRTHKTKLVYINNVLRFLRYMYGEDISDLEEDAVDEISSSDIERFVEDIGIIDTGEKRREMSSDAKAQILSSLSMFFGFMAATRRISENPFENKRIRRPRKKEKDVVFLTPEEVKSVEQSILARSNRDQWKWRDLLLFRIPVINGLRVTALSEINVDDIDFANGTIRVVEKGNVHKDVYVDQQTMKYIRYWLSERREILLQNKTKSDALFISSAMQRITIKSIERLIVKLTSETVPGKHITPHKLRSTCGVNMYQAKKDIYLVASVLGHRSTEPTRRYTKVFDSDKQNAINELANIYN